MSQRNASKRPVQRQPQRRQKKKSWLKRQFAQRPLPIWIVIIIDVLLLGIALVVFALFHHVIPEQQKSTGIVSSRENMVVLETAVPEETPEPTAEIVVVEATETPAATATPDPVGYFGTKYAKKFNADGSVNADETSYVSGNINVKIREFEEYGSDVFFADIYIKDISSLQTAFGKDTFGKNYTERVKDILRDKGAVIAINGDYYGARDDGVVIRNGELYRNDANPDSDVCVLYWDGSMDIIDKDAFDAEAVMAAGAYQAWTFGPSLLDADGRAFSGIRSSVSDENPRTAIGYFQPGHYAFVVVDGRTSSSDGVTLDELAKLMESIGCKKAYNLDGGNSSAMAYDGQNVNRPSQGGREISDVIMIMDGE
ncbi:MAG: phosphodiester glycosidase family protein [Clostridia bacterium]|nr:phosphodiester glycosidase family protein [Clostridia bacterium]